MGGYLKQSTAAHIMFGPFVDKTNGVDLEVAAGIVTSIDHATTGIFLSKNGGAGAIRHQNVTASVLDAYGMFQVHLDTTDTDTVGNLRVMMAEAATFLPVHDDFIVLPANVYDSLMGTDTLDVQVTGIGTDVITAASINTGALTADAFAADAIVAATLATGALTADAFAADAIIAATIASGAITNAKFAAGAIDAAAIANGAIDNATFAADVGSTAGATNIIALAVDKSLELAKIPKSDGTAAWNTTAAAAIQKEANDALIANNLDHFMLTPVNDITKLGDGGGNEVPDSTVLSLMLCKGTDTDTYNHTTDSLESIRDKETDIETDTAVIGALGAGLTAVPWNAAWDAEVQSEVVDALNVDTYAEPAQGIPAATASIVTKIGFLYKAWRNRKAQTATQYSLYNDDAATVDHKATVSDNGTTFASGEVASGP